MTNEEAEGGCGLRNEEGRRPQDGPKIAKETSKTSKVASKTPPRRPRWHQDGPKDLPKTAQQAPKRPPRRPAARRWGVAREGWPPKRFRKNIQQR